jgi:methylase of polypeptide subunit release factors
VDALGDKVYPSGKVWMPTSQRYLINYFKIIKALEHKPYNVLDLGCGCGILSFLFGKTHKKSRVIGIDKNPEAVNTTNINAARLGLTNIEVI